MLGVTNTVLLIGSGCVLRLLLVVFYVCQTARRPVRCVRTRHLVVWDVCCRLTVDPQCLVSGRVCGVNLGPTVRVVWASPSPPPPAPAPAANCLVVVVCVPTLAPGAAVASLQLENSRLREEVDSLKRRLPALGLLRRTSSNMQLLGGGSGGSAAAAVEQLSAELAQVPCWVCMCCLCRSSLSYPVQEERRRGTIDRGMFD